MILCNLFQNLHILLCHKETLFPTVGFHTNAYQYRSAYRKVVNSFPVARYAVAMLPFKMFRQGSLRKAIKVKSFQQILYNGSSSKRISHDNDHISWFESSKII